MPKCFVQINEHDARRVGIEVGDLVDVRSRRGVVRLEAKIGEIAQGQVRSSNCRHPLDLIRIVF
jgi:anaerobic selenocysteine-containing dehydrogenase